MSLFPSIFCTIAVFSLYEEYVVRFALPGGVFLLVTIGWIFYISLCKNSINQSIKESFNGWGGRRYDESVPGEVTKIAPSGDRTT